MLGNKLQSTNFIGNFLLFLLFLNTAFLYYSFDNSTVIRGSTILNQGYGGPAYNAQLINGAFISALDRAVGSGAVKFSASLSQYVQVPNITATGRTGLSFAFWFKFSGSQLLSKIVDFGNGPARDNIVFGLNYDDDAFAGIWMGRTFSSELLDIFRIYVNDNVWRHAVWTLDTNGNWKVYLNGALRTYAVGGFYPNSLPRAQNYLGKGNFANDPYLNGAIDEFYMFKFVLSAMQVQQLYSEGECECEQALFWSCFKIRYYRWYVFNRCRTFWM